MKKLNFFKTILISFLGSFIITLYATKFKSIALATDLSSYLIYFFSLAFFALITYSNKEISDWGKTLNEKEKNLRDIPNQIYKFIKMHYNNNNTDMELFLMTEVSNIELKDFLKKYFDKNSQEEIQIYIKNQRKTLNDEIRNTKKVVKYNGVFILLSTIASYIYDSNIKGILFLSAVLFISNILFSKNIDKIIDNKSMLNNLFENIYQDITHFKNAKYIMYKAEELLMLDSDYTEISEENKTKIRKETSVSKVKPFINSNNKKNELTKNVSIPENRKSSSVMVGMREIKKRIKNNI